VFNPAFIYNKQGPVLKIYKKFFKILQFGNKMKQKSLVRIGVFEVHEANMRINLKNDLKLLLLAK
jgi:hypothetical protein